MRPVDCQVRSENRKILESNGGWAVTNQDNIFLLSYLYLHDFEGNPYYNDPKAFEIIKAGGNALRAAQREDGQVLFVKPTVRNGATFTCRGPCSIGFKPMI